MLAGSAARLRAVATTDKNSFAALEGAVTAPGTFDAVLLEQTAGRGRSDRVEF
jgi:hypothetical protein